MAQSIACRIALPGHCLDAKNPVKGKSSNI
jgi:hypothetical protein